MVNTMEKEVVIELYNNNTRQVDFISSCLFNFFKPSIFLQAVKISSMPDELTDPQLLHLIQDGDKSAFTDLVNRHANRFYRIAFRFLNNRDNSEDVVQDAFLKLWENTGTWKPDFDAKFTTWFSRIVINLCLDLKKKNKNSFELDDMVLAGGEELPDETVIKRQNTEILNKYLEELPDRQQIAINLCFYEGFSNREAAEIMEINIKALESLLVRAKSSLRNKLVKWEGI
jgi:RNA polymerase sigma-70 factor (ECF subfamily)